MGFGISKTRVLYADDLADALVFLMKNYNSKSTINIGTGEDISILNLADKIQNLVKFEGKIIWNTSMPDGTLRKRLDISKINNLGWRAKTSLLNGIDLTYSWYKKQL